MAGFNNEVLYSIAQRLQPSTTQAIGIAQNNPSTDVSLLNFTGDPNGVAAANPSSLSHDPVSGFLWIKVSGTGTTVWQRLEPAPTAGFVQTLTGNTGGPIPPDGTGTINVVTANTTVKFAGAVNTETLDFGLSNLIIGNSATSLTSGTDNVGLGLNALSSVSSGGGCTCIGFNAGQNINTSTNNTYVGFNAGSLTTTGSLNTAVGVAALNLFTSGTVNAGSNTAVGYTALSMLLTGIRNTCLGVGAGANYTGSESSNTCIANAGVIGESHALRLGTTGSAAGEVNTCYVAAITGVTVAASAPVAVASTGQLSSLGFGTATQVLTSNGAGVSPTWQAVLPSSFPWIDASGAFLAVSDHGYFLTAAATPTLPAAPSQGDIIEFFVDAAATMTITANTGQTIQYTSSASSVAGTLTASAIGNSVRLVYRAANTTWNAIASMGASWTTA